MRWRHLVALPLALLGLGVVHADVVKLRNGREIRGTVIREDSRGVVVKTRQGQLTLPVDLVAEIQRESAARNRLELARQAVLDDDLDAAARLLDEAEAEAREAGETQTLAEVERERRQLSDSPEPPAATGDWSGEGDPFAFPEEQALIRELSDAAEENPELGRRLVVELYKRGRERHDQGQHRRAVADFRLAGSHAQGQDVTNLRGFEFRCRLEVAEQALHDDAWRLTCAATQPLLDDPEQDGRALRRAAYLQGRALELMGEDESSRRAFLRCLEQTPVPAQRELATLRELARLHSAGVEITAETPGVGAGWRWLRTRHFAILHQLDEAGPLARRVEEVRREVVQRLSLGRLDERGQVALFLFADQATYHASAASRSWMAGHAQRIRTDDELIRSIYLYPGDDFTSRLRHEIAHILVGDALDDAVIPAWGAEGVAVYAEGDASLQAYYQAAAVHRAAGRWVPTPELTSRMLVPTTSEAVVIQAFYAQAAVTFDQLQQRASVRRALQALVHVNHEGDRALRRVNTRVEQLDEAIARALEQERR